MAEFMPPATQTQHIGHALKARREALELSIADVSASTNLRADYLMAIEALNVAALPSIGYVLGYVRTYARMLGLNADESVIRYKADVSVPENLGRRNRPHFVPKRKIRLPRGFAPALTVLGFAVMIGGWYGVQIETQAAPSATPQILSVNGSPENSPRHAAGLLTLEATAPSWVQVKDAQGKLLISRIFVTGETWQGPTEQGFSVSVRDGGAVELWRGASNVGPLGAQGQAVADMPLY